MLVLVLLNELRCWCCVQLIWEEDRARSGRQGKQSFVDMGCGNGLLVYILTKEGVSAQIA